ncbi:hypothetical protein ACFPRL_30075 [Pseudoclavibacter helvolus]
MERPASGRSPRAAARRRGTHYGEDRTPRSHRHRHAQDLRGFRHQ